MAAPPAPLSPYLDVPVSKVELEEQKGTRFSYAVANCQGWRTTQEDSHNVMLEFQENTSLFCLYDGHNGQAVARFVARYLPTYLIKNTNYKQGNIEAGLQEVFLLIDDDLLHNKDINDVLIGFKDTSLRYKEIQPIAMAAGSTGVVLLIKNDIYYCANVGDSRCVIARDGKALVLTRDHKPDNPEERARVEKAGGSVINGRINMGIDVSRSFGDGIYKRNPSLGIKEQMITPFPYTVVQKIEKADEFIVLFCDGIWNAMSNQQLVDFIAKRIKELMPLAKICDEVIKHVFPPVFPPSGIAGKDNMTVMIIRLNTLEMGVAPSSSRTNQNQRMNRKGTTEKVGGRKGDVSTKAGGGGGGGNSSNKKERNHHKQPTAAAVTNNEAPAAATAAGADAPPERKADKNVKEIRSCMNPNKTSPPKKKSKC